METQFTARHFDASPALQEYATKSLSKLERYYDGIVDAHIVLSSNGAPSADKTAEITVGVYQQRLAANDSASTYEQAIDSCVERLRRQLLRYKRKLKSTDKDYHK